MKRKLFFFLLSFSIILQACTASPEKNATAESVLTAMFTCPNEELFDPASLTTIGIGTEDKTALPATPDAKPDITEKWQEQFSSCFTEKGFASFIETGYHTKFHVLAYIAKASIDLEKTDIEEENDFSVYTLSLKVQLPEQEEKDVAVQCRAKFDNNSKIEELTVIDDSELYSIFRSPENN